MRMSGEGGPFRRADIRSILWGKWKLVGRNSMERERQQLGEVHKVRKRGPSVPGTLAPKSPRAQRRERGCSWGRCADEERYPFSSCHCSPTITQSTTQRERVAGWGDGQPCDCRKHCANREVATGGALGSPRAWRGERGGNWWSPLTTQRTPQRERKRLQEAHRCKKVPLPLPSTAAFRSPRGPYREKSRGLGKHR